MMRNASVDDITADELPLQRELQAAYSMKCLLWLYTSAVAMSVPRQARGIERIITNEDELELLQLCHDWGTEAAWQLALRAGFFCHMDAPMLPGISFDLNAMTDCNCRTRFRFDHYGIKRLVILLGLPAFFVTPLDGDRFTAVEGVCLVLDRMTYPRKLDGLQERYDRHVSALSRIFNYMLHRILVAVKGRVLLANVLTPERLEYYARAFWKLSVPRQLRVWSIVDVKKVQNCRPTDFQRTHYNGHKNYHCFKYQTLETPDDECFFCFIRDLIAVGFVGLIAHCYRCADGRRGDAYILQESNLLEFLRAQPVFVNHQYVVFGDSAFPNTNVMATMFRGRNLPEWAQELTKTMASVRRRWNGDTCKYAKILRMSTGTSSSRLSLCRSMRSGMSAFFDKLFDLLLGRESNLVIFWLCTSKS